MVVLMLMMSISPMLMVPTVSAHAEPSGVSWPLEGSDDTGWVTLDATGADSISGQQASTMWNLSFAPGAELSNVTLEIRASGQAGMTVEEPMLAVDGLGVNLLDWRGLGVLGEAEGFASGPTYSGRMSPNSNSAAGWDLPSSAVITDLVIQTLAPVDPAVSLRPLPTVLHDVAVHPDTGVLFLAMNNDLMMLHANTDPHVLDLIDLETHQGARNLVVDTANGLLHVLAGDGSLHAFSLLDLSVQSPVPAPPSTPDAFMLSSAGEVFAANNNGLMMFDGASWTSLITVSDSAGTALALHETGGVIYAAIQGTGVLRYDTVTAQSLSAWSSANVLHSDSIHTFLTVGNQLLLGSLDNGIGRYNHNAGFWLSTWNEGNWLDDNRIGGIAAVGDAVLIANGPSVHTYNTTMGVFGTTVDLSSVGLVNDAEFAFIWPSTGPAAPTNDTIMLSDGSGLLAKMTPQSNTLHQGNMLLSSGPATDDMQEVLELGGVVYIGTSDGTGVMRYDVANAVWQTPWSLNGQEVLELATDGTDLFVGTDNGFSVEQWSTSGALLGTINGQNCSNTFNADIVSMAVDAASVFISLSTGTVVHVDRTTGTCSVTANGDLPTQDLGDVALHNGIGYVASQDEGVLRYDIANGTWMTPWISTGVNGVSFAPVATVGNELFLGLPGYGVARKNLLTGEILAPFTSNGRNPQLPSNQIYALESDGSNLYIGTQQGARKWDGSQFTTFGQGSSWDTRPNQFFDFAVDVSISGGSLYAATNIGVCKYSIATLGINDCQNVFDGMPNWATYSVGLNSNYVFGGTTTGVGVIDKSTFQHDFNWGEASQTGNAVVEIIDDIAYIGTDGLGVLRYNLTSGQWLSSFSEANGQLDGGNDDITGLVADVRPGHLWVGGNDGFQLINTTTGAEIYDIETNSNLYDASGSAYQMTIHNGIMYYHSSTNGDEVGRLDVVNFTNPGALDIGTELSENNGDVYSMHLRGDHLFISLSSGQWWNADGSGGIAVWNTSSNAFDSALLPTGSIDRVTAYTSSNGNTWVAWGELRLDLYAPNGTLTGSWDGFDLPIRGIVEFEGLTLMAANDEILRYNETSNQWATAWSEGVNMPSNAGDQFLDLWTDGSDLIVGGARLQSWGGFAEGIVSHLDGSGAWTTYEANSDANVPNGYPIAMVECGGLLNIAMYPDGIARLDVQNQTMDAAFERFDLDGNQPASVACDTSETLYVGYYQDNQPISKYSYTTSTWLTSLTQSSHNLPADRIWYDGLAHANGQLIVGHGIGSVGSAIGGGYSLLASNGASSGQAAVSGAGSSVTSLQWMGSNTGWMIGQAGGTSGYSHVSTLSSLGIQKVVDLPGLVSGQVTAMASNATHIWAATGVLTGGGQTGNFGTSAGLLQGTFLPNGSVEWDYGWTLTANSVAGSMHLDGTDLYITTNPSGLMVLDTTTGAVSMRNGALHNKMDTMAVSGTELIIGLSGDGGSPPGVQRFDVSSQQFTSGRLVGGLPSSVINGFTETSSILYIATDGGVGRWDYAQADWMDSITAANGLPTSIVEDILAVGTTVYMATPLGLVAWDETTGIATTIDSNDGLLGDSTWGLTVLNPGGINPMLVLAHDGRGAERPGVSIASLSSNAVDSTHRFDQLPSNTVTALASDWWGVHVATGSGPLTHWNSSSDEFEDGNAAMQTQPSVTGMVSDGEQLLAMTSLQSAILLEARTGAHAVLGTFRPGEILDGTLGANHLWITTEEGLFGWENSGQYSPVEDYTMRRAHPLTVRTLGNGGGLNITDMTHPGVNITLVDPSDPYALNAELGTAGAHGVLFQNVPLVFTSPVNGAAVWTQSERLLYDITLDLSNDPALGMNLQSAVDVAPLYNNTRHVSLRLLSPSNGSMEARITYDYVRTDTPVVMQDLTDRPDDGGGALMASWSLVHDEDFARYVVFVNEGPWETAPTEAMLMQRTPDKAVSLHSRLSTEVQTANGVPLQDGVDYHAVVVVEYNDGRWGDISPSVGPATSSNEVPRPPAWAQALPAEGDDNDGDLSLEWARCTALDLASTNVYVATTPFTDAFGLTPASTYLPNQGNLSTIALTPGVPVWIGWTCVDQSGQENLSDITVVGPVVPTGELNDNQAPDPIEGTRALDVPEDEGGRINVEWNASDAEDCAFYTVFMSPWDEAMQNDASLSLSDPSSVESFSQAAIINDCLTTSIVLNRLDGIPLTDGRSYAVGVVAYDAWLNGNIDDVTLVLATPMQNVIGQGSTPNRITTLLAFDHPEDDGTAIDVVWEPSQVDDFASYTVWVADQPVTDLSALYALTGTDANACGCFSFNKQWIDEETNPIQLTLSTALYTNGGGLTDGAPGLIQPGIELYTAVTVHDLRGNVHLTDLTQATVTPVDNLNDNTAPERLTEVRLVDRPNDNGQALLLDFDLSEAGDVAAYEVYAATYDFNGEVTALLTPVATLGRNPALPVVIDLVAGDTPVVPGQQIWAAVVVVDSSSNSFTDMLTMVSAEATNEGITDPGVYLPDIANVGVSWFEETSILVEWNHSTDARVRGYQVYIHDEAFEDTGIATMVGEVRASNSYLITSELYEELDNTTGWHLAVVAFDETVSKTTVESLLLLPVNGDEAGTESTEDGDGLQLESLLTGPNLVAAGMVIVVLLLLVLVARSRSGGQKRNKNWELQEATWGIETPSWEAPQGMPAPSPPQGVSAQQASDIYAAAEQIQSPDYGQTAYQAPQPVVQPRVDMNLLDGLVDEPQAPSQPKVDTSFLDDLL